MARPDFLCRLKAIACAWNILFRETKSETWHSINGHFVFWNLCMHTVVDKNQDLVRDGEKNHCCIMHCAAFAGGNRRTQRKPTETRRKHVKEPVESCEAAPAEPPTGHEKPVRFKSFNPLIFRIWKLRWLWPVRAAQLKKMVQTSKKTSTEGANKHWGKRVHSNKDDGGTTSLLPSELFRGILKHPWRQARVLFYLLTAKGWCFSFSTRPVDQLLNLYKACYPLRWKFNYLEHRDIFSTTVFFRYYI